MVARIVPVALGVLVTGAVLHSAALAQGTGRSMDIDGSLRSAAMGGASNGLFRGGEVNHWGNPALLAYLRGVRYERHRSQLVPGLATDVWITGNFTKVGAGGVGFVFGGEPDGPEGIFLDYGSSEWTDEQGNPTGTFGSFERVRSWGFGVSVVEGAESLARMAGGEPLGIARYFDVSVGMNFKHLDMTLAPGPFGSGSTDARDVGALVRVTPVDGIGFDQGPPIRVDLSYGWSVLSFNDDATVTFDMASPVTRHRRQGGSIQLAAGAPGRDLEDPLMRALARGFAPLISVSLTADRAELGGGRSVDFETSGRGFEVAIANIFAIRRGHYTDRVGDIDGDTRGFSVGLPLGSFGGFAYEEAWIPQARNSELEDVHRTGYAVWVDPFEIARVLLGGEREERSVSRDPERKPPALSLR
jgi:hypothetical protein